MSDGVNQQTCHTPVLVSEVLTSLQANQGGSFLDCTLGGGGHTRALLEANPANRVVACDRDSRALERAQAVLSGYGQRLQIQQASFSTISQRVNPHSFDGILADLGLSSDQLAEGRGFSFQDESPLDMRMDETSPYSAAIVVNELPPKELFAALKRGGVGREARAVTDAICRRRPIKSTRELAEIVAAVVSSRDYQKRVHPATVVFQALRIEVNQEITEIEALLTAVPALVRGCARFAVISFHSLEDKLVASKLRYWEQGRQKPALWPEALPQRGSAQDAYPRPIGKLLTKKALTAGAGELEQNARARSARLRVFEFFESDVGVSVLQA